MNSIYLRSVLMISILLLGGCKYHFSKGNKEYDNMSYSKAIKHYEMANQKEDNLELQMKLADSYRLTGKTEMAEKYYAKVVTQPDISPEYKLRYAQMLDQNGKHLMAKDWYAIYAKDNYDQRAVNRSKPLYSNDIYTRSTYDVDSVAFGENNRSVYCPVFYSEGIVYTSEISVGSSTKKDPWTGRPFLELQYSVLSDDGDIEPGESFSKNISTPYHEGMADFTPDEKTIYFTRSNYNKETRKPEKNEFDVVRLKIYRATLIDGEWKNEEELPFNSDNYSTGHPALSSNGKILYFVSDMPGGYGETDIYQSLIYDNGTFSRPENLGSTINTSGKEMFPSIAKGENGEDILYFSSNGHKGWGGLDIYATQQYHDGWTIPKVLPLPANSAKDDFGILVDESGSAGYLSSARNNEDGIDALYKFYIDKHFYMQLQVINTKTEAALDGVKLRLMDRKLASKSEFITDTTGIINLEIIRNNTYDILASKEGFNSERVLVNTINRPGPEDTLFVAINMSKLELEKPIVLKNIYYDFDKYDIRPDAAGELDDLVVTLIENPAVEIELSSHADSRGTIEYNQVLAQKRAEAAVQYIVDQGIDRSRLTAKGYGEKQLVNECSDGVECTHEQHQMNRRTEFKVTSFGNGTLSSGN